MNKIKNVLDYQIILKKKNLLKPLREKNSHIVNITQII